MENVKQITTAQLTQMLLNRHTPAKMSVFSNITIDTDARLLKRGNPYQGVRKHSTMNVMLNTEYESGVLNQLKREGKEAEEYQRGTNTMPLVFGENNHIVGFFNGEAVLQFRPYDNSKPTTEYYDENGIVVAKENIAEFMPKKSAPTNQGTEKEIMVRKVYMKNVKGMTIDGTKYIVKNN